jgi:hypothetical protein
MEEQARKGKEIDILIKPRGKSMCLKARKGKLTRTSKSQTLTHTFYPLPVFTMTTMRFLRAVVAAPTDQR